MKRIMVLVLFCLLISFFEVNAQTKETGSMDYKINLVNKKSESLELVTFGDEESYQLNIANFNTIDFSSSVSFRLEDELHTDETYKVWQDVSFLDFNVSYTIGPLNLSLGIENILNFKDNDYAIEPDLVNNNVVFIQEDDFLINATITYNF